MKYLNFPRDRYHDTDTASLVALFKLLSGIHRQLSHSVKLTTGYPFLFTRHRKRDEGREKRGKQRKRRGEGGPRERAGGRKINFYKKRVSTEEKGKLIPQLTPLIELPWVTVKFRHRLEVKINF